MENQWDYALAEFNISLESLEDRLDEKRYIGLGRGIKNQRAKLKQLKKSVSRSKSKLREEYILETHYHMEELNNLKKRFYMQIEGKINETSNSKIPSFNIQILNYEPDQLVVEAGAMVKTLRDHIYSLEMLAVSNPYIALTNLTTFAPELRCALQEHILYNQDKEFKLIVDKLSLRLPLLRKRALNRIEIEDELRNTEDKNEWDDIYEHTRMI